MMILLMGYLIIGPFEQIYAQYNNAVLSTGDIIETYAFRMGISSQKYGFATAVGLLQGITACLIVMVTNYLSHRFEKDAGVF
jgi:putative aldouronate transport system permease protein